MSLSTSASSVSAPVASPGTSSLSATQTLAFVFLVLLAISLVMYLVRGRQPPLSAAPDQLRMRAPVGS